MSKVRSATESVIRAEELELLEDGMNIDSDVADPSKPDFPALSAIDAMVSQYASPKNIKNISVQLIRCLHLLFREARLSTEEYAAHRGA